MTEPSVLVKRLALIFAQHGDHFFDNDGPSNASWDDFSPREQLVATAAARAAIEAMMEPTDEMIRSMLAVEWPATYREHLRHPMDGTQSQLDTENRIKKAREKWQAALRTSLSKGEE